MIRLGVSDMERVARLGNELAAAEESEAFPSPLLESLRLIVGSEFLSYSELDRVDRRLIAYTESPLANDDETADAPEDLWRLRQQWPTRMYEDKTGDFSSRKLSDFVTLRELRRREIYADFFRPAGVEYEIGVGIPAPLTHTKIFLFTNGSGRGDFGERERTILDLLRPLLALRYRQIKARRRADAATVALETTDEALVLLSNSGRAEFATPRALRLLAAHGLTLNDLTRTEPLLAHAVRPGVLLLSERRPFGLTTREREILALVAEGRTNAETATALWISPATVRKHLENTFAKLGVTTRTAAVRSAREHRIITS